MPEIVEIKLYADFIKNKIKNNKLLNINIINGRYKKHGPFQYYNNLINILPLQFIEINTKGKFMYIKIKDNLFIGISLGLFGGWLFRYNNTNNYNFVNSNSSYIKKAIKHLNVEFVFEHGSLYYYDQLSFGTIKIFNSYEELLVKLNKIGLDVMDPNTTYDMFLNNLTKKRNLNKFIGLVLLDQKTIAGIGNYLRADLLWLSKISPFRKVKDINDDEFQLLFKNIKLLTWSLYDYDKAIKLKIINKEDKLPIDYKKNFLIYNNNKDIYNNFIIKEKLYEGNQVRYIYWVPDWQK
jgi:formamidopyrimidine-DNA glycosylase